MCGIAGIVAREPLQPPQRDVLARINQALVHRGPDGAGEFQSPHLALAMRRLSIIDTAGGWQPLYDEDRNLALVSNGEIYNYVELREGLLQRGHRFRTGSDCEVIPHLYQEHGTRCVDHLRGMFAFALWDSRERTLLLARDRMGEKPLFLYEQPGSLVFASELRALLRSGAVPFELDPGAIDRYFHYQYVPDPQTPIRGVRKLRPGHVLIVRLEPWSVEERCYWRMEDAPPLEGNPAELIRAELETISRIAIRSDVPVGIALSGGLDSSALAALTSRKYPGTMHAFSAGYPGRPRSDERADAKALADHLDMPFHQVEISDSTVVESFADMVGWQDDLVADLSGFGYWMVAQSARENGVPVLLQGQGGDELFWGYRWVREAYRQSMRKRRVDPLRGPRMRDYLRLSWPSLWPRRAPLDWAMDLAGLRGSLAAYRRDRLAPPERLVFYDLTPPFRTAQSSVRKVYTSDFAAGLNGSSPFDVFTVGSPSPAVDVSLTRLICQTYLLGNGIARGDRLSMAASVELRLPLVDYRLVETVIGLRKARSDAGLPPKAWLREAIADVVPEWVMSRPKRGFQAPTRPWTRAIFAAHGHLLEDGVLVGLGILRPEAGRQLRQGHFPVTQTDPLCFTALMLEVWCRQWTSPLRTSGSIA
jgi:asparagine synthase (glutamine-hydrolysing)